MPLPRQTRLTPARPGDAAFHVSGPGAPAAPARSRSQAPRRGAPRGRAAAPQARPAFPRRRTPRRTARTSRHRPAPPQRQQPETDSGCRPGNSTPAGRAEPRAAPTHPVRLLECDGRAATAGEGEPYEREERRCLSPPHNYGRSICAGRRRQLRSQEQGQRAPAAARPAVRCPHTGTHRSEAPSARRAPLPRSTHIDARTHPKASTKNPPRAPGGCRSGGAGYPSGAGHPLAAPARPPSLARSEVRGARGAAPVSPANLPSAATG